MANNRIAPEVLAHKEWLGQIQQVGLVVTPAVLVRRGVGINRQVALDIQRRIESIAIVDEDDNPRIADFATFARDVLEWPADILAAAPADKSVSLPEHDDVLTPAFSVVRVGRDFPGPSAVEGSPAVEERPIVLVSVMDGGFDSLPEHHKGWRATPHARLERLLRENEIPIGLLYNATALRLVYAPRGESSGHLTFRLKDLLHTQGRPMAGALHALLHADHFTGVFPDEKRLPALLKESRKFQNEVSTKLSGQVLEALWELLRGFQRANEETNGRMLAEVLREDSNEVYGGLLVTLMRLVFILYAEDRGLMAQGEVYQKHYSLLGLFDRLQDDEARHPDTMDARYGAWAQMLALFRLVHDGGSHGDLRFPARHGRLFDPDAYPFLEGRPAGSRRSTGEIVQAPKVSDGAVFRILRNLLILDGERLSYRALDVEQIGSVYEAMMGFALRQAAGPSIAVQPKHIVFDVSELLEQDGKKRAAWLQEHAEAKVTGEALVKAKTPDDVVAALGRKVSLHTPHLMKAGDIYLQPTEERRRSGSHYTPRSLTEPIVRTTFRPIFERLGERATPEQILDLKVCDPAMGSGAFLVEACRLLADRLVRAWETHRQTPKVPDDEDVVTYARRLVAERCLYGVDKNIFAVDLAKLSLWLATLAREHPFTFLDHALRHGDSLVGLSREQIACFNWEEDKQLPLLRGLIDERVKRAQRLREQIQGMATSDDVPAKARLLREANDALEEVRRIGDMVVSAFFEREKPKDRHTLRKLYAAQVLDSVGTGVGPKLPSTPLGTGQAPPVDRVTFHWEIEFPEVFTRANPGFDAFVGNPPFLGGKRTSTVLGDSYRDWLVIAHTGGSSNADLVAYFLRRAFAILRNSGALGLLATNTVAQGDTRRAGLAWINAHDGTIYSAERRIRWPGQAAVIVSVVHIARGPRVASVTLDGKPVPRISAYLMPGSVDADPNPISAKPKRSFIGCDIKGQGFTFDDDDVKANARSLADDLIRKDPRNAVVIRPYMGGEEINTHPEQKPHRAVIDFETMSETEAEQWPDLLQIARTRVRPERLAKSSELASWPYWQFWRPRAELQNAKKGLAKVICCSQISKYRAFAVVPAEVVLGHKAVVIASDSMSLFAVLSSRSHEEWALAFGSTMKDDPVYTPSDCFDTFPFPATLDTSQILESVGASYNAYRQALMVRRHEGLTKTYNRFHDPDEHDPDIVKLRDLHAAMDRAVLDAYGWTDIQPTCEFILDYEDEEDGEPGKAGKKKKPWRYRWPDDVRDEVLGRLLALNAERAAAQGQALPKPMKAPPKKNKVAGTPLLD